MKWLLWKCLCVLWNTWAVKTSCEIVWIKFPHMSVIIIKSSDISFILYYSHVFTWSSQGLRIVESFVATIVVLPIHGFLWSSDAIHIEEVLVTSRLPIHSFTWSSQGLHIVEFLVTSRLPIHGFTWSSDALYKMEVLVTIRAYYSWFHVVFSASSCSGSLAYY